MQMLCEGEIFKLRGFGYEGGVEKSCGAPRERERMRSSIPTLVEILGLLPGSIALQSVDIHPVVDNLLFRHADLPFSSSLRFEVKEWQRYWRSKEPIPSSINLSECISHADEDTFQIYSSLENRMYSPSRRL